MYVCRSVVECWTVLAQDPVLSAIIIEQFLQLMNNMTLYNVQADRDKLKIATLQPLAVSNCENDQSEDITCQVCYDLVQFFFCPHLSLFSVHHMRM